jgi:hypothetical protein
MRWGFNDLQRRQDDLCIFIRQDCTGHLIDVINDIGQMPLPLSGH